uniref:EGF-like domain-containing protein n=2 Tax=Amphimedon queenslandica TaxID=400682 RepID=A0A1X7SK47_AMPQE
HRVGKANANADALSRAPSICNNSCEAGYTLNTTTCTCSLSNICELSPCQNGGSCTLVSAPSNYTCDCTGTGYQGISCSTHDWSTAASKHVIGILPVRFGFVSLVITTPETETVNFTVSNLTQTIANGSVTAGIPTTINDIILFYAVNSELERYKGLLVTSGTDKKISVTVSVLSTFPSRGIYINYPVLVYPVHSYVYYAVSIGTDESSSFSSLLIVSGNNNTNIRITPTVTVTIPSSLTSSGNQISLNAGQSITIQLQYLETFLLKPVVDKADLTGTKLESNNPISVYSGHTCVLGSNCDFV